MEDEKYSSDDLMLFLPLMLLLAKKLDEVYSNDEQSLEL
jgi:hypothetical protein